MYFSTSTSTILLTLTTLLTTTFSSPVAFPAALPQGVIPQVSSFEIHAVVTSHPLSNIVSARVVEGVTGTGDRCNGDFTFASRAQTLTYDVPGCEAGYALTIEWLAGESFPRATFTSPVGGSHTANYALQLEQACAVNGPDSVCPYGFIVAGY